MTLSEVLIKHGVTVDLLEPVPLGWLPLLDELLGRMVTSGWRHRRIAQVKEKFGTLGLYVDREGESDHFLAWASMLSAEFREPLSR